MEQVSGGELAIIVGLATVTVQTAFRFGEAALKSRMQDKQKSEHDDMLPECASVFGEVRESLRSVHYRINEQHEILKDIQTQTRATNGRVTRLEAVNDHK